MRQKSIFILFFIGVFVPLNAQLHNPIFKEKFKLDTLKTQQITFGLKALHYASNSEYFGTIAEGRTWLGYSLMPKASYRINKNFVVSAGAFARKDHGKKGFSELEPYFRMTLFNQHWRMNLGNLEAAANHNLLEPILDYESNISQQTEHGVQFLANYDNLKFDAWVDWNVAAFRNEPFQEELTTGLSTKWRIFNNKKHELSLPFQTLITHKGGQVNSPTKPLVTRHNSSFGFEYKGNSLKKREVKVFTNWVFGYDNSGTLRRNYKDGYGLMSGVNVKAKRMEFAYIFWRGEEYEAEKGMPLYVSATLHDLNKREQVVISSSIRAVYNHIIAKGVMLDFRAGIHYDHIKQRIDHDAGLFVMLNL